MAFKHFFQEKFNFEKFSLPFAVKWIQIAPTIWRTSFGYDNDSKTVGSGINQKSDVYDVTAEYIGDPYSMESAIADVAHDNQNKIKHEPYWWIDFESREWGTGTTSRIGETPRNARIILKTVIAILAEKVPIGDNISFTSGIDQPSKISLYSLLANTLAKQYGKTVEEIQQDDQLYFFIH
jgi:hypothetical protein